ncbi:MAG: glutathione peroxidase [Gammaproteobacteria bacterium]
MLENREGQKVPEVTFKARENNDWKEISSKDIFAGKNVVVFSLPGAFTPTCSSSHVPRYNELAPVFFRNGIDEIVCISVNDAFVMNEWKEDQEADNITFIPDGNGQFTEGMGMLVDKDDLGFGKRSWRYSMLVKDGVIDKMFIEPQVEGDPYEVSDADTMLEYINPKAEKLADITVLTKEGCSYCARAKGMLHDRGLEFQEIVLGKGLSRGALRALSGSDTVPQVFVNGEHIGGSEALEQWLAESKAA